MKNSGMILADLTSEPFLLTLIILCAALSYLMALGGKLIKREMSRIQEELMALKADSPGEMIIAEADAGKLKGLRRAINVTLHRILYLSQKEQAAARRNTIASIAHDFRGPLSSIRGYTETLQEKMQTMSPEQQHDCLEVILRNVSALDRIVSSSLTLSKLDVAVSPPTFKAFRAQDLLLALEERFAVVAREKSIRFTTTSEPPQALIKADYAMLERALVNLIENAITYTPAEKTVAVSVVQDATGVELCVTDEGIGIGAKHLPHIFEEFYRVDKDRSRITGGAGLGLALVKKIVEAHGSQIHVESTLDKGTVMRFRLNI